MIGLRVTFSVAGIDGELTGEIMDKVNIPLASGSRDYVPMDHYIVKDKDRDIHCVNPINIKNVLKPTNMLG